MKALNSSEVKAQVKTVIDDLENVLGELREVVTELRGIVDQIDTITARLDIDGEGDGQAQGTNPSSSTREPPNGRVTSPRHFELGQTENVDGRGQTPGSTTHRQNLPNGDLNLQGGRNMSPHSSQASTIHSANPVSTHTAVANSTRHGSLIRRHRVGEDHVISPSVVRALTLGRGIPNGHVNTYQRGFSVDQALSHRDGQPHASTLPRQNLVPGAAVAVNGDIGASPTRFGTFRDGCNTSSNQPPRKSKPAPPQRRSATLGDYADYMTVPGRVSGEHSRQTSKESFRSTKSQNLGREFERRRERCDPVPGSALRTHSSGTTGSKKEKRVEFRTDDVEGSGRVELTRQHSLKQKDYEAIQRERYAGGEPVRRENSRRQTWQSCPRPMSVPTSWVQDEEGSWHRIAQNSLASDYGSLESFRSAGNYSSLESFRSESPGMAVTAMDTRRPGTAPGRDAAPPGLPVGGGTAAGGGDPAATYATINRQARLQYSHTLASPSKGQSRQGAKGKDILMTEL